jgi:hypothetical protein
MFWATNLFRFLAGKHGKLVLHDFNRVSLGTLVDVRRITAL